MPKIYFVIKRHWEICACIVFGVLTAKQTRYTFALRCMYLLVRTLILLYQQNFFSRLLEIYFWLRNHVLSGVNISSFFFFYLSAKKLFREKVHVIFIFSVWLLPYICVLLKHWKMFISFKRFCFLLKRITRHFICCYFSCQQTVKCCS